MLLQSVALALAGKAHLAKVNVRENELEDAGAVTIAQALALLPALRYVIRMVVGQGIVKNSRLTNVWIAWKVNWVAVR